LQAQIPLTTKSLNNIETSTLTGREQNANSGLYRSISVPTHPGQPLLDRYRMNTAAGLSRDEAMTLALAGRVRVKARTA
jgi:hypothetical protein